MEMCRVGRHANLMLSVKLRLIVVVVLMSRRVQGQWWRVCWPDVGDYRLLLFISRAVVESVSQT